MNYRQILFEKKILGKKDPPKEKKEIAKKSDKKLAQEAEERKERGEDDTDLQKFFRSAMTKMTGFCAECHARTETHVYQYAIFSIAHLVDKRDTVCPSVKTHPHNWIELCPDHHNEYDRISWQERKTWGCWPDIYKKLLKVAPNVAEEERRHLPDCVRDVVFKKNN